MALTVVFFGTDYLAEPILQHLLTDERFQVLAVVTQPDRPTGRKRDLQPSPVKIVAQKNNLPVFQPERLRALEPSILNVVPDFFVVAEFGQIIPPNWLAYPTIDTINVHPSLLPKYRGPTPIQSALWNGDTETGVTIMQMVDQVDAGAIVTVLKTALAPNELYAEVEQRLATASGPLLCESLIQLAAGQITPTPQVESEATYCQKLTRDSGRIDWHQPANAIYNQFRALTPWPGIWTTWNEQRLKLLAVKPDPQLLPPGKVSLEQTDLKVGTGAGSLIVTELQLEGRKPLSAAVFLAGATNFVDSQLQ